jgi:hypothetical protein
MNREDLVQDTQATLREVAGILHELWDLQGPDEVENVAGDGLLGPKGIEPDLETVVANAHRETLAIREELGILKSLLPHALVGPEQPGVRGLEATRERKLTRASEVLAGALNRLNRLASELDHKNASAD